MTRHRSFLTALAMFLVIGGCSGDKGTDPVPDPISDPAPKFVLSWGDSGLVPPLLLSPMALACDPAGNVFVVDSDHQNDTRVQKFDADGRWMSMFRGVANPQDAACFGDGVVVLGVGGVGKYRLGGAYTEFLPIDYDEAACSGAPPTGVAFTQMTRYGKTVWALLIPMTCVSSSEGNKLKTILRGDYEMEKYVKALGPIWDVAADLTVPGTLRDVAIGKATEVQGEDAYLTYVIGDDRIRVYAIFPFADSWFRGFMAATLDGWGGTGDEDGKFNRPTQLACDVDGNVYVVDSGNHRIQKFDSEGKLLAKWGSEGEGDGQFLNPRGIAVDSDGNIYISDLDQIRIQKFR